MANEKETKEEEKVVEEKKSDYELLTPEQQKKAADLLKKEEAKESKKIDWKKTGKRACVIAGGIFGAVTTYVFGFKAGQKSAKGKSSETSPEPYTTVSSNDEV